MTDEARLPQQRHVFVDPSGRRAAWLRRGSWGVSVVLLVALFALVLALVAPPRLTRLVIPGLGGLLPGAAAPRLEVDEGGGAAPRDVLSPLPKPSTGLAVTTPEVTGAPAGGTPASGGSSPRPIATPATGRPTTAPTPGAGPSPTAGNRPPTPPGQATASAPPSGQGKPTARPTPRASRPAAPARP